MTFCHTSRVSRFGISATTFTSASTDRENDFLRELSPDVARILKSILPLCWGIKLRVFLNFHVNFVAYFPSPKPDKSIGLEVERLSDQFSGSILLLYIS